MLSLLLWFHILVAFSGDMTGGDEWEFCSSSFSYTNQAKHYIQEMNPLVSCVSNHSATSPSGSQLWAVVFRAVCCYGSTLESSYLFSWLDDSDSSLALPASELLLASFFCLSLSLTSLRLAICPCPSCFVSAANGAQFREVAAGSSLRTVCACAQGLCMDLCVFASL